MHGGDGRGRTKHYSNTGEEMKTASKKKRSVSFCNIFLIYSTRTGLRKGPFDSLLSKDFRLMHVFD